MYPTRTKLSQIAAFSRVEMMMVVAVLSSIAAGAIFTRCTMNKLAGSTELQRDVLMVFDSIRTYRLNRGAFTAADLPSPGLQPARSHTPAAPQDASPAVLTPQAFSLSGGSYPLSPYPCPIFLTSSNNACTSQIVRNINRGPFNPHCGPIAIDPGGGLCGNLDPDTYQDSRVTILKIRARTYALQACRQFFTASDAAGLNCSLPASIDVYVGGNFANSSSQAIQNIAKLGNSGKVDPRFDTIMGVVRLTGNGINSIAL